MVDVFLIIVSIVTAIVMIGVTIYVFFLYCHPDDNGFAAGWYAKAIVIASICITWGFVLMMPLDVANSRGLGGGLNMDAAYMVFFIAFFIMIGFVLPFSLFLYESDPDKNIAARLCMAFWLDFFLLVAIFGFTLIAWLALRYANVANIEHSVIGRLTLSSTDNINPVQESLTNRIRYQLPAYLFMCVFLIFLGWFFFVVFGGIGIVALPFDMILDYFYRPRPRSALEMAEKKVALRRRAEELLSYSRKIENLNEETSEVQGWFSSWKAKRTLDNKEGKLQKELFVLEQEYEIFEAEEGLKSNPVWEIVKLILGILLAILSFFILLHLLLYKIIIIKGRPADTFLNAALYWLEFSVARFFAVIFFTGIAAYLIICVLKGAIKFGLRLFFIVKIHPMKLHLTYMNSFLFNAILIMLAGVACMHFMVLLFSSYMRLTTGMTIFGVLLTKLVFLKIFWEYKIFLYAFLAFAVLTFFYLLLKPKSDRMNIKAMIARRKAK